MHWLEGKWPRPRTCPVCRQNPSWSIYGPVSSLAVGQQISVDTYAPLMLVTCSNCAHTLMFNAVQMGIMGRDDDDA